MPYNRVQEILREETDRLPEISVGKLADMEKKFQSMTAEERQKIGKELLAGKSARDIKIHMKPNGGMRSDAYAGHYADTASVLETERLKGRSRYRKVENFRPVRL